MTDTLMLVTWLVKATAVLMLAMAITAALRRAPAGARYVVWLATLAALLLVPVMSMWSPLPLPVLPSVVAVAAPQSDAVVDAPALTIPAAARMPSLAREVGTPSPAGGPIATSTLVLVAWASVVALTLAWLLLGAFSVRRIMRRSRTLTDEAWLTPLYETADRLDLDRVPRLIMSSTIEMPFACSVLRPTIVLPASADAWSDARRRVVLFHELAHIRRRDLLGHTLGRVVCAFYWFHPLVWSAAKRLRAESERACDDLVLACGARASDYANHLLEIVTGVRRVGAPATALPMANKREFEGRMLAILDPELKRNAPARWQTLSLTAALAFLSLTIAAAAPTRRAVQSPSAPSAIASTGIVSDTAVSSPLAIRVEATRSQKATDTTTRVATSQSTSQSTTTSTYQHEYQNRSGASQGVQPPQAPQASQDVSARRLDTTLLARVLRTDKDAQVRKAAAWALQGRRDGVPLLLERLRVDSHESVREMAAWGLASTPTTETAAAIAEALKRDPSDEVRATAAWAMGCLRGRADIGVLESALGDASADVRERALWALGQQELERAPARVISLLTDNDHDVRVMAAWVLGVVQDKATIPALREAFMKERDSEAMQLEFRALAFMGDRSQPLIDHAMASEDVEIRARAVRMIGGLGPGNWPWPWPWPDPRPEP